MADPDFEVTWYARLGKDAAVKLRRCQRSIWFVVLMLMFSMGASVLFATNSLGDVMGGVSVACGLVCFGLFVRAQFRTAAAASVWFWGQANVVLAPDAPAAV